MSDADRLFVLAAGALLIGMMLGEFEARFLYTVGCLLLYCFIFEHVWPR